MTKDEWFDNLEVINQLTLAETAIARINVPSQTENTLSSIKCQV